MRESSFETITSKKRYVQGREAGGTTVYLVTPSSAARAGCRGENGIFARLTNGAGGREDGVLASEAVVALRVQKVLYRLEVCIRYEIHS